MTAIIIDDEKHCRDVLMLLLQKHCAALQVLDTCADGPSGLQAIERHRPDLVFLDIEMPGMNGFDMLSQCRYRQFKLIFTTAYDEYAIQAIKHNALDYLLKPVEKEELVKAVERAAETIPVPGADRIEQLLQQVQPQKSMGKVALPTLEGLLFINPDDIFYCESDGGYTRFFAASGKVTLISKTLKEVEDVLDNKGFCRVHNSYLINLKHVERYIRGDGGEIIMADGKNIPVSRNKKQEFLNLLEKI